MNWGTLFLITSLLTAEPAAFTLSGTGVAVQSGDTFTLRSAGHLVKVRLEEVDAPEEKQTFGPAARKFVQERVMGRPVTVRVSFVDVNGRRVGRVVYDDGRLLNEEIVAAGLAWHYRVGPHPDERLRALEHRAFAHSLGLWVQKHPAPPWEYRREAQVPDAPRTAGEVDYDRIFEYDIVGDPRTRTYQWPACRGYGRRVPQVNRVFLSREQAGANGFRPARGCPAS